MKFKKPEKYCRYCGRELELGRCYCDEFIASKSKPKDKTRAKICDTCKSTVDADSVYCPYCGMPLLIDGNNKELQKELRGDNAKDVVKVYAKEMKTKNTFLFPLSFVVSISVTTLLVGILFGYLIVPEIKKVIFNYNFSRQAEMNGDLYGSPNGDMGETTDINYDLETESGSIKENGPVAEEISAPTAPSNNKPTNADTNINDEDLDEEETDEEDTETTKSRASTVKESTTKSQNDKEETTETEETEETAKKATLWLEKATRIDDVVGNGVSECKLVFYFPTINGDDENEVALLSELYKYVYYADFMTQVKNYALEQPEFPVSIVFDVPKDQGGSSKVYRTKLTGHVTLASGLKHTINYTIIYSRSNSEIRVQKSN